MSVKKTTKNYTKNMPHGLTTITNYVNFEFFFSLRKLWKVKLSMNQSAFAEIQDKENILRSNFEGILLQY